MRIAKHTIQAALLAAALTTCFPARGWITCTSSEYCPSDENCVSGECVPVGQANEPVAPPPAPPAPEPRQSWFLAYVSAATVFGIPGTGSWSSSSPHLPLDYASGNYSPQFHTGTYLSAYFVPVPLIQIGAYGRYLTGASKVTVAMDGPNEATISSRVFTSDWGIGISLKLGGRPVDEVWLGGIIDVGGVFFRSDRDDTAIRRQNGFDNCLRLGLDWILTPPGGFRMGLTAGAGIEYAAWMNGKVRSDSDIETSWSWIQPVVLVGVLLGG
jgi:hypothetical protein